MRKPGKSSGTKVQYDLRVAKQVERRMLVDAFQRLSQAGFEIRDYRYTGFGAYYFVDFILFHKILGIHKMLTVEADTDIEDRVYFNKPFNCIDVAINPAADVIPTLSPDLKHILWLDYDFPVRRSVVEDLYLSGNQLSVGSILLITVDVEPPRKESKDPKVSKSYFEEEVGDVTGLRDLIDFTEENLPNTSKEILLEALNTGLAGRKDVIFLPLFHFIYADTNKMLTIGGMVGTQTEARRLRSVNMDGVSYFRTDFDKKPYEIFVPKLTSKERYALDAAMPCPVGWQHPEFKLPEEWIKAYREIYRFLPAYAELLY